jgi:hypothetical protein
VPNTPKYLQYKTDNAQNFKAYGDPSFSWDDKWDGIQVQRGTISFDNFVQYQCYVPALVQNIPCLQTKWEKLNKKERRKEITGHILFQYWQVVSEIIIPDQHQNGLFLELEDTL